MNVDSYVSHQTSPPKASCRRQQNASKSAKHARRRRVELRRIRSVPQSFSSNEMCLKKIKSHEIPSWEAGEPEDLPDTGGGGRESKSYGQISVVGRKREMDDVVAVELGFLKRGSGESYDHFGVYNGRGGWRVARACGQLLHKMLAKIVEEEDEEGEESGEEIDWEDVMSAGFNMMDAEVNKKGTAAVETGSTAVVTLVGKNEVVVASCGGSRVVLSRGGVVVQLLDDYKLPDKGENRSVIGLNWNRGRVPATSKALVPKVRVMKRSDADEFLILGSGGLWDVIPNELACQVARKYISHGGDNIMEEGGYESGGAEAAAALMAELAVARGSRDNISIIVIDLKNAWYLIFFTYQLNLVGTYFEYNKILILFFPPLADTATPSDAAS